MCVCVCLCVRSSDAVKHVSPPPIILMIHEKYSFANPPTAAASDGTTTADVAAAADADAAYLDMLLKPFGCNRQRRANRQIL